MLKAITRLLCLLFGHDFIWLKPDHCGRQFGYCISCSMIKYRDADKSVKIERFELPHYKGSAA